ncbi:hypothetical protein SETIT_7G333800v2 [Setaria italica]|uniref:Uncharacterized protein n=1 Tax=Setaria italica TaxID=4555 RepID=K3YC98_SETIT|nr:hypothetical protein SETIT_7G333800v2 [Setaria italica]
MKQLPAGCHQGRARSSTTKPSYHMEKSHVRAAGRGRWVAGPGWGTGSDCCQRRLSRTPTAVRQIDSRQPDREGDGKWNRFLIFSPVNVSQASNSGAWKTAWPKKLLYTSSTGV